MKKLGPGCFKEPGSLELRRSRIQARRKRRLTYDCMGAIVKGDSVVCKFGHAFKSIASRSREGMSILSVLRGRSSSVCQNCSDYDGETQE